MKFPTFYRTIEIDRVSALYREAGPPSRVGNTRMMNLTNILAPTPLVPRHLWAVLLAGGDGARLRDLTVRIAGDDRPKQFCPIVGAESLLRQTRARLDPLSSSDRQAFVVSYAHERYYAEELFGACQKLPGCARQE